MRALHAALLVATLASGARGADVGSARFGLSRGTDAQACPDEATIARELAARLPPSSSHDASDLLIGAIVTRDGDGYSAELRVAGRKQGTRVLHAAGPSCEPLHEALVVALLVLLDDEPPAPDVVPGPPPRTPAPERAAAGPSLWLSAGWDVTHGLPRGWSGAVHGDVGGRFDRWDVALGAEWAPPRSVASGPGTVEVRAWGGRARACYAPYDRRLRIAGCVLGALRSLRGEGVHLDETRSVTQPWGLAGIGADAAFSLTTRLSLGFSSSILATIHREAFSVDGLGAPPYETDAFVFAAGADLRFRIW